MRDFEKISFEQFKKDIRDDKNYTPIMYAVENNIDTSDFQSLINSGFEAAKKQLLTDLTEPNEKNVG